MFFIKDFDFFIYDHTSWKKYFCRYCLQHFSTESNGKQRMIMPKKV